RARDAEIARHDDRITHNGADIDDNAPGGEKKGHRRGVRDRTIPHCTAADLFAFTLTLWTVPTWTPDQLAVALSLTTYCLVGPLLKEKRFRRRFGQTFTVYQNRVPYWLPWPRPLIHRNDLSFYDVSADWWGDKTRWLRTLQNLVPARFSF